MDDTDFLGAKYSPDKTLFSVASEHATAIDLCLFSADEKQETKVPMTREGNLWIAELPHIVPGQKYGFRAHGEYDPTNGL